MRFGPVLARRAAPIVLNSAPRLPVAVASLPREETRSATVSFTHRLSLGGSVELQPASGEPVPPSPPPEPPAPAPPLPASGPVVSLPQVAVSSQLRSVPHDEASHVASAPIAPATPKERSLRIQFTSS